MIKEIWDSAMRLPAWVLVWVAVVLVPVNVVSLGFLDQPYGRWVAILAIGGMIPNAPIMIFRRGISKLMSVPHLIIWSPLVILILWMLMSGTGISPATPKVFPSCSG